MSETYRGYTVRKSRPGLRSRVIMLLMRWLLRPRLAFMLRGGPQRVARLQMMVARRAIGGVAGVDYRVLGRPHAAVPGHVFGALSTDRPVVLWIHGGAFLMPAAPDQYMRFLSRICGPLGASGFMPDYRIAPANPHPAALDDCERAYQALLDAGFSADKIVLGGESAGGNLILALLQRIRDAGLPMPACAVPVSPATDLGRLHGPRSRGERQHSDVMLSMPDLAIAVEMYSGGQDTSDPELSPLFADFSDFPPTLVLASTHEVLRDDSVMLMDRAREQGAEFQLSLWSDLPHAFPLIEDWIAEAQPAREEIASFMQEHLQASAVGAVRKVA